MVVAVERHVVAEHRVQRVGQLRERGELPVVTGRNITLIVAVLVAAVVALIGLTIYAWQAGADESSQQGIELRG